MHYGKLKKTLSSLLIASMLTGQILPVYAQDAAEEDITAAAKEDDAAGAEEAQQSKSVIPAGLTEGVDYVAGHILAWTDNEEEAQALAEAYEGELISWNWGSTLIAIDGTVEEALSRSIPEGLPKAEPDYIIRRAAEVSIQADDAGVSENTVSGNTASENEVPEKDTLPERRNWEYWYDGSENADPYLNPADDSFQWFHGSVDSFAAWGVTTGKDDIRVVLVGSAADASHEDLAGAKLTVNDVGEIGKEDATGNGTHAAGLIAGQLKNGKGGAGIAPGVKLLSISVMDSNGDTTDGLLTAAIGAAMNKGQDGSVAGRGAEILDFTDIISVIPSESVEKAIKEAIGAGVTVIAGVGDEGSDALTYPAAYEGVIRVGAAEKNGTPAAFSNKCSDMIYAPGVDIICPRKGGGYESVSSTGSAAAIVTGMAALYMSAKGYVKPDEMKKALKDGVKDGCVNMAAMFEGSTEAPNITIYDGEKLLQFEKPGKSKTPDTVFTGDSTLVLVSRSFSHDSTQSCIIYTTNGKTPAVKNGEITEGQIYKDAIPLASLCSGTKEQEVTIQAATISGMGVISDLSSVTIKVLPEAKTEQAALEIIDVPEVIVPGNDCNIQLKAQISGTITSPVMWKRESADVKCELDEKTGLLKVLSDNASGEIAVFCYAERPKYVRSETVRIQVNKDLIPVTGMSLAQKSLSLNYSSLWDEDKLEQECGEVRVEKVTSKGANDKEIDLLNNGQYLYLRWSSSNEKVLKVEPSEDRKSVRVIPVGAGTAKVVCTAMDGHGVSASVKVTVKQFIEDFEIGGPLYVLAGKSYTYKARNVKPDTVEEQGVTWMIRESGEIDWASVNTQSGVVTVKKKAEEGDSFTLVATTMDGSEISREVTITVVKKLSKSVVVSNVTPEAPYYAMKKSKKTGCVTSLNLYTKKLSTEGDPSFIILSAAGFNGTDEMEGEAVWSCSDPTVLKIEENAAGVKLTALKPGSVTLTCKMNDGSGKKAKVKVKVMNPVEGIELSGQTAVARGASATFKAASYLPAKAGMKKVEWSLVGSPAGVTVSSSGKVKVTSAAALGTVTLLAKAKDACGSSAQISFLVVEKKTKSFELNAVEQAENYDIKTEKKSGRLSSLRLFSCDMSRTEKVRENRITIKSTAEVPLKWTASDGSLVTFDVAEDGRSAVITARKSGTVTITATAADGSKKKRSFKMNIVTPASDLRVQAKDGQDGEYHFLACGKSVDVTAALGTAYGTPTTQEVKWRAEVVDVSPARDDETGLIEDWDIEEKEASETKVLQQLNLFTFNEGKLTVAAAKDISACFSYLHGSERNLYPAGIRLVATTTDGTELEAEQLFILTPIPDSLCLCKALPDGTIRPIDSNTITLMKGSVSSETYHLRQKYKNGMLEVMPGGASVSSSNPGCVSASYDPETGNLVLRAIKESEQPVTITIKAKDGSGKSVKYTVDVS